MGFAPGRMILRVRGIAGGITSGARYFSMPAGSSVPANPAAAHTCRFPNCQSTSPAPAPMPDCKSRRRVSAVMAVPLLLENRLPRRWRTRAGPGLRVARCCLSIGVRLRGHCRRAGRHGACRVGLGLEQADGEDQEADADEQQCGAHRDDEGRDALREVRRVERALERGRADPDVAGGVLDCLAGLRVLGRGGLVAGRLAGLVEEPAHLRVRLAAGGLERVLADRGGELLRLVSGVDLLAGDGRIGRADDLLAGEVAADGVPPDDADDHRADAERDEHDAGGDAALTGQTGHCGLPLKRLGHCGQPAVSGRSLHRAVSVDALRRTPRPSPWIPEARGELVRPGVDRRPDIAAASIQARVATSTALIVCSRFSAWSKTTLAGERKTSSVTSSPFRIPVASAISRPTVVSASWNAGRQCMNLTFGLFVAASSAAFTW